jgi:hypothetical protein
MNALLDKAIVAIRKLPEAERDAIAREILERIEAEAEIERGEAFDLDPAHRSMP